MRRLAWIVVIGVFLVMGFKIPGLLSRRQARLALARHATLMQAISKRDVEAIRRLVGKPIDIYATDFSGETPIALAEKSGDATVLEALKGWRIPQKDLWRAQKAVDAGTTVGLQPPKQESAFPVPRLESLDMSYRVENDILALPEGERKEWALRNFASRLAEIKQGDRALRTALRLKDPKMCVESLLYIGQCLPRGSELERVFDEMRNQIQTLPEAADRDPLYAQLAWLEKLRGYPDRIRSTCFAIQLEQYKNGTCKPGL